MNKLQRFCKKLQAVNLCECSFSEMNDIVNLIYQLIAQCNDATKDINMKLKTQNTFANNVKICIKEIVTCIRSYEVKISEFNNEISDIDMKINKLMDKKKNILTTINIYNNDVNGLKERLNNANLQNNYITNNINANSDSLNEININTKKATEMTTQMVQKIDLITIKKLNNQEIQKCIMKMCNEHFYQKKFENFINIVTNNLNYISTIQINQSLLKNYGLTNENDINIFMTNYRNLLQELTQNEIKKEHYEFKNTKNKKP